MIDTIDAHSWGQGDAKDRSVSPYASSSDESSFTQSDSSDGSVSVGALATVFATPDRIYKHRCAKEHYRKVLAQILHKIEGHDVPAMPHIPAAWALIRSSEAVTPETWEALFRLWGRKMVRDHPKKVTEEEEEAELQKLLSRYKVRPVGERGPR